MLQEELYNLNQGDVIYSFFHPFSQKVAMRRYNEQVMFLNINRKITSATSSVDDQWNGRDDEVTCRTQHRDDALRVTDQPRCVYSRCLFVAYLLSIRIIHC